MFEVRFSVPGHPVTQGSKQPFIPMYRGGIPVRRHKDDCIYFGKKGKPEYFCECPIMVNTVEDNGKELEAWREACKWRAKAAMRSSEPVDGLVIAHLVFALHRPKNHYGTGRNARILKQSVPAAPGVAPDAGKLARAVEDALKGTVYGDDSQIVTSVSCKRYVHRWEDEGVDALIRVCEIQTVADLMEAGGMPRPEEELGQLGLLDALSV